MAKDALGHGSEKHGGGLTDTQAATALGQGHPKSEQVPIHDAQFGRFPDSQSSKWDQWNDNIVLQHEPTGSKAELQYEGRTQSSGFGNSDLRQVLVTGVATPEGNRGKGGARAVLRQAESFLDSHKLVGRLNAGTPELQKLYAQHGFVKPAHSKFEMFRKPR